MGERRSDLLAGDTMIPGVAQVAGLWPVSCARGHARTVPSPSEQDDDASILLSPVGRLGVDGIVRGGMGAG